jgi:putative ABC transport system permease protein
VQAVHGRTFTAEEDRTPGTHAVALLGYETWRGRFGGDPAVVGRTIRLNRAPFQVVGVLPPGFRGLTGEAEVWVPMQMAPTVMFPEALEERWAHWFRVVARPRPELSAEAAAATMATAGKRIDEAHPIPIQSNAVWGANAVPLREARLDPAVRTSILVLAGAVTCVLLIACANVANLLLARATGRRREVAVRLALGAGRRRLVRQLLTESLLLALAGGAAGLLVASWSVQLLAALRPALAGVARGPVGTSLLDVASARLDGPVLLYSLALSVLTGIVFGTVPALLSTRPDLTGSLKEGAAAAVGAEGLFGTRRRFGTRDLLVAGEIALALVLLLGAGLMLKSFARLRALDPGFRPEGVLTFRLDPPEPRYTRQNAAAFKERLLERLAALPGVEAASVDYCPPLQTCNRTVVTRLGGGPPLPPGEGPEIGVHSVGEDHFRALGIPILAGRAFTPADREGAPLVAILNQAAARRLWPRSGAVGRQIQVGIGMFGDEDMAEVVGVVGDVKYGPPELAPGPDVYVSYRQYTAPRGTVMLRAAGDPIQLAAGVRAAVQRIDPELPVFDLKSMEERAADATARSRYGALLLAAFAALAVALAGIGVYGVMSYAVAQRRREMGLRMALGARPVDVVRLVVGRGALLAALGVAAGLVAGNALTRFLEGMLFDVATTDPAVFTAIAALLTAVALLATYLPARRARRVDPMTALKTE